MAKSNDFTAIVLAAGKGKRMSSPLPKVLHPVAGWPMISRVITSVQQAGATQIRVVVGHGSELVERVVGPMGAVCFTQKEQKGTAHAVQCARPEELRGTVVILNGDHPLITAEQISMLVKEFVETKSSLSVVTAQLKNPKQFGRIIRHHGQLKAIVEARDASHQTLQIKEVNTGIYLVKAEVLCDLLPKIRPQNNQNEYYLTDIVSLALDAEKSVHAILASSATAFGVNTQVELAKASRYIYAQKVQALMAEGAIIIDPQSTYIEDDVVVGAGTVIYPGSHLRSGTRVGGYCVIEPNCYLSKSQIGDSVQVRAGSYFEEVSVGDKAVIGPYARLRPGTKIGTEAKVGNFVEMKKVDFGDRAQASHLTYLGDAEVGEGTNIGCGTITCNYAVDKKKYVTKIGKGVFVGSDSQLVAPVEVGDNAVIASGSTITKNVPKGALAVARGKQYIKENYKPKKPSQSSLPSKNPKESSCAE